MSNITLGQIVAGLGVISAIAVFVGKIIKIYKENISIKFDELSKKNSDQDNEIDKIKSKIEELKKQDTINKVESKIVLRGLLACLKGLKEQGCDGPVTESVNEIEKYLLDK